MNCQVLEASLFGYTVEMYICDVLNMLQMMSTLIIIYQTNIKWTIPIAYSHIPLQPTTIQTFIVL